MCLHDQLEIECKWAIWSILIILFLTKNLVFQYVRFHLVWWTWTGQVSKSKYNPEILTRDSHRSSVIWHMHSHQILLSKRSPISNHFTISTTAKLRQRDLIDDLICWILVVVLQLCLSSSYWLCCFEQISIYDSSQSFYVILRQCSFGYKAVLDFICEKKKFCFRQFANWNHQYWFVEKNPSKRLKDGVRSLVSMI